MTTDTTKDIETPASESWSAGDTLCALDDALEQFAGCTIVISHDRWFLDRIATHILAFEGESTVTLLEGTARPAGRRARRGRRGVPSDFVANDPRGRWQTLRPRCARNFSEYEDWRKQQLGDATTRPHRITYRKLTR